jgi:hypothetical protein
MADLTSLNLSSNSLKTIVKNTFKGLFVLDLNSNVLASFERGCFSGLNDLQELLLNQNQPKELEWSVFKIPLF